jgi:hypothetical protein
MGLMMVSQVWDICNPISPICLLCEVPAPLNLEHYSLVIIMASFSLQLVAGLVLAAIPGALAGTSKVCTNPLTSCGTSTSTDTCCFNTPGGQLLQTQFWDTSPSTGRSNGL